MGTDNETLRIASNSTHESRVQHGTHRIVDFIQELVEIGGGKTRAVLVLLALNGGLGDARAFGLHQFAVNGQWREGETRIQNDQTEKRKRAKQGKACRERA